MLFMNLWVLIILRRFLRTSIIFFIILFSINNIIKIIIYMSKNIIQFFIIFYIIRQIIQI